MSEHEEWLKQAALMVNRLILMAAAQANQPTGEPEEDRITDTDIDTLEATLMAHLRREVGKR
jgi:hypothetical protein